MYSVPDNTNVLIPETSVGLGKTTVTVKVFETFSVEIVTTYVPAAFPVIETFPPKEL